MFIIIVKKKENCPRLKKNYYSLIKNFENLKNTYNLEVHGRGIKILSERLIS